MTGLSLIRVDQVPAQAWRNGGGTTQELFTWPGAGPWQLRISVAEIRTDGPFSAFPGVDRWFAVAEGDGVVLHLGAHKHSVRTDTPPMHFDGAAAPACSLQGGPTRDLNLMGQRAAGRAQMLRVDADVEWISSAPLRALFTTVPLTLQIDDADAARVPAWALVVSTHAAHQRWRVADANSTTLAWWMDFSPRTGT